VNPTFCWSAKVEFVGGIESSGRFLGIPIETVRRRADRLKKEGVLRETEHGLIVTDANQFKFGNNHELQKTNILLVRKFLRDLMEAGIEVPERI
jgi:DNA-binding IclR family transcriptional regulator